MKKMILAGAFLVLGTALVQLSFTDQPAQDDVLEEALLSANQQFKGALQQFLEESRAFHAAARQFSGNPTAHQVAELRHAHLRSREAFKKAEYLAEYLDHETIKMYVNGPPLPSLEKNVPHINVLEPIGLQVLDELVFGDDPVAGHEEIGRQAELFQSDLEKVISYLMGVKLEHRFVFEAAQEELVRIFTLGLTGFDTPGSANAIPEAHQAMLGMYKGLNNYLDLLPMTHAQTRQEIIRLFEDALGYLKANPGFEDFDRLHFLKTYTNPLNQAILQAQRALHIETIKEVTPLPQSINRESAGLFYNDFLNPNYFANIGQNEYTDKRIELGRLLFFDPILSNNVERACASCHSPGLAFTDGMDKSLAINGDGKIGRNAPTVINSVFAERYFYDLREPNLERQIKHVVMDPLEFDTDFLEIVEKLHESEEYKALFTAAYANQPSRYQLSKWSISDALACYITSLHGFNSPFDRYVRGETASIDPAVARGFNLFMGKAACGTCHFAPVFNGTVPPLYQESESEVLGVPATKDTILAQIDPDLGRMASSRPEDEAYFYAFSFKTPTVRNIALTGPYMHNGVYHTLEEVMDFYNRGGGAGIGIELEHQTLPPDPLNLTQQEIKDIISFMEALTDTTGMTAIPSRLPQFQARTEWNNRIIGGAY